MATKWEHKVLGHDRVHRCMRSGECVGENKGQFAKCQGLAVREVFANLFGVEKTGTKSERRQRGGMGCDKKRISTATTRKGPNLPRLCD